MIVGAAVLIPLMLGTILIARYVDIRSATVQASRYVAFERATNLRSVTDADIERKLRARMFTVSDSPLRADDGLADNAQWRDENPNWKDFSARAAPAHRAHRRCSARDARERSRPAPRRGRLGHRRRHRYRRVAHGIELRSQHARLPHRHVW